VSSAYKKMCTPLIDTLVISFIYRRKKMGQELILGGLQILFPLIWTLGSKGVTFEGSTSKNFLQFFWEEEKWEYL
jgi:hypothetical protein